MKLPTKEILKNGFQEVKQSNLKPIKNIIVEYVAIYLTDKYNKSLLGFDWSIVGDDIAIKNIKWLK